jgi:REP element-mobilizing transposase RayT
MTDNAIVMDSSQRVVVEQTIRDHCRIRNWTLHAVNVRTNHVHVVVTADRRSAEVMKQLKAWCSRRLSGAAGLKIAIGGSDGRRRWFTEGGDQEVIGDDEYFHNAVQYVLEGQ